MKFKSEDLVLLALEGIHNFSGEILFIESENDDKILQQTILNYVDNAPDKNKLTHVVLKDAPHSIKPGPFRDKVEEIYLEWFKDKASLKVEFSKSQPIYKMSEEQEQKGLQALKDHKAGKTTAVKDFADFFNSSS